MKRTFHPIADYKICNLQTIQQKLFLEITFHFKLSPQTKLLNINIQHNKY